MKSRYLGAALALAIAVAGAGGARAGSVWENKSVESWHAADDCAHAAFQRFPDYTRESNAARDRARRDCELKHHVAPRNSVEGTGVGVIPDSAAD